MEILPAALIYVRNVCGHRNWGSFQCPCMEPCQHWEQWWTSQTNPGTGTTYKYSSLSIDITSENLRPDPAQQYLTTIWTTKKSLSGNSINQGFHHPPFFFFFSVLIHQDCCRLCLKLWLTFWQPFSTKWIYRDQQNSLINLFLSKHKTKVCDLLCSQIYFLKAYYVSSGERKRKKNIEKKRKRRNRGKKRKSLMA